MGVASWLQELGLERYEQAFRENEVDDEVLPKLTAEDLIALGVNAVGHRRKMLEAIAALCGRTAANEKGTEPGPVDHSEAAIPKGERRQLTVLFCDLVGSTEMSARLDPEDLREIIAAYHRRVAEVVEGHQGYVAKYMGDGVLAYFGYPRAQENDAEHAVRAGLALVDAIGRLIRSPEPLQARVGIATGMVVVGDVVGSGEAQERSVVGETPNLASRLQAMAEPNTVVIAESTRRLTERLFEYHDLGLATLKGFGQPVQLWEVRGESAIGSRFEALRSSHTPLVGREEELELLLRRWRVAQAGAGRVVLLSGEPGIGKSRLVAALGERLAAEVHLRFRYFCSPHHNQTPLYPVVTQLEHVAGFEREDTADQKREKLQKLLAATSSDEDVGLLAELLSLPQQNEQSVLQLSPQKRKERTLAALIRQLRALAHNQPILMLWEDVHWIDPTSRELLDLLVAWVWDRPVLLVITFRPEFVPAWAGQAYVTALTLSRLDRAHNAELVQWVTGGKTLPSVLMKHILAHTDGVPLFVEELTKALLESSLLQEKQGHYVLTGRLLPLAIPATLQASLVARLDRLPAIRELAQIGATIGREFSYELLAAVAKKPEADLQDALAQLTSAGLVFVRGQPPDAVYSFKHALVRDAAYGTLLRRRRQQLHAQIADVVESRFLKIAEAQPELLAHHYTQAGAVEKAIAYRLKAGELGIRRSALAEAVAQLTIGLELLGDLLDGLERRKLELQLQLALARALLASKGLSSAEMGRAYARARELSHEVGEARQAFSALQGLFGLHQNLANLEESRSIADEALRLAGRENDPAFEAMALRIAGVASLFEARFAAAVTQLERALSIYDRLGHGCLDLLPFDARIMSGSFLAWALLCDGRSDAALRRSNEALSTAHELSHPYTLAFALHVNCVFHQLRDNQSEVQRLAATLTAYAADQGFAYFLATGTIFQGWARGAAGEVEAGLADMRKGLQAKRALGAELKVPYYLGVMAGLCSAAHRADEAVELLDTALAKVGETGERWFEAELHRLKGEALEGTTISNTAAAEACFLRAIRISHDQGAHLWQSRAVTSLARLWRDQGRNEEARDILARHHT